MDKILVMDFGGQYCHLISRRIKDLGVYSEVVPGESKLEDIVSDHSNIKGIILSGGANSVFGANAPLLDPYVLLLPLPILGICYGHQLIANMSGGIVEEGKEGEYGLTNIVQTNNSRLLEGVSDTTVWMNHRDKVIELPPFCTPVASTDKVEIAAFESAGASLYGVQFHPEVTHTKCGKKILENFTFNICDAEKSWSIDNFIEKVKEEIRQTIGNKKAVLGLSGGVDSSTAALLVSQVIGKNLKAVYVDTGLMRQKETEFIKYVFEQYDLNLKVVDASEQFFVALKGITDPEQKRKIIGAEFIKVFEKEAEGADFLIQGTIYSDRIESGLTTHSSNIKSHHNVGGLPKKMKLKVYEPLRDLYKDEVRKVAKQLNLDEQIITRYVFPGPGFGIRILGEVTQEKADIVRRATYIVEDEVEKAGLQEKTWMAFAVLPDIKNVGIQGDERSYKYPIIIRAVESEDAMTANFSEIPYAVLKKMSTRITNDIKEVNRVVYDITNKPPGTMEWE